jgi:hypothetical protein
MVAALSHDHTTGNIMKTRELVSESLRMITRNKIAYLKATFPMVVWLLACITVLAIFADNTLLVTITTSTMAIFLAVSMSAWCRFIQDESESAKVSLNMRLPEWKLAGYIMLYSIISTAIMKILGIAFADSGETNFMIGQFVSILIGGWLMARTALAIPATVFSDNTPVRKAIEMSKGKATHICVAMFISFLVTLLLGAIASVIIGGGIFGLYQAATLFEMQDMLAVDFLPLLAASGMMLVALSYVTPLTIMYLEETEQ